MKKTFVGFGFGAIQAGLFLYEASRSGNFDRLIVAEVVPETVEGVRKAKGNYRLNVATDCGIETHEITGVELLNPVTDSDREALIEALSHADEIATALPSVNFYESGAESSIAALIAEAFKRRIERNDDRASIIYTAENDNHAAEKLEEAVGKRTGCGHAALKEKAQFLNTVIGKMSGVVADNRQIEEQQLATMTEDLKRCFLVEAFNRILISRIHLPGFTRGISVFEEKDNLLPFEEAKLYGHNATHALIGFLARKQGYQTIADVCADARIPKLARQAFLEESGMALCRKYKGVDILFTEQGYRAYAEDLLKRMMNPHLRDAVERVVRDPRRKLSWNDRLTGTIRLALQQGIRPNLYALGAKAAVEMLVQTEGIAPEKVLDEIWAESKSAPEIKNEIKNLILHQAE